LCLFGEIMLRTRLWMGALLIALAAAALVVDERFKPWYPILFIAVQTLCVLASVELLRLLPENRRPPAWLVLTGVTCLVAANWLAHVPPSAPVLQRGTWGAVVGVFAAFVLAAFLAEMAAFREPGDSVPRVALAVWAVAYLGVLPGFLVQLRWQNPGGAAIASPAVVGSTVALALVIFVPKCGDIGAYFTGRLFGRHRMAPVLSPGKTWEGAAGGLAAAAAAAVAIDRLGPVLPNLAAEVGLGLALGIAGLLGDLAESLVKRDCRRKDAAQTVPGFGGVLDVVDAVLFAAPVGYGYLSCWNCNP
jgi:phosphatidate cytidylyltransferase